MIQITEIDIVAQVKLADIVSALEATLDASELKDKKLVEEFYHHWGNLETEYACSLEMDRSVDEDRVRQDMLAMRAFLFRTREAVLAYDPADY